mgnify:CR=1 FL=1
MTQLVARVVIDSPLPQLDRVFDYLVPNEMAASINRGSRVLVQFGRGRSLTEGFVVDLVDESDYSGKLSEIEKLVYSFFYNCAECDCLLSEETLAINIAGVKKQLSHFLDFNSGAKNAAELVNNYDWFKDFTFLDFIRDVGKHITVNYMMAKDSVKKRIEGDTGMSFTEFTYQLVQGYDFYWLHKNKNCKLQMGGSDQWGNITTGTELVRRKSGGEAFAFTCPLITKADGGKFGKTEKGNVWLDAKKTSPYQFYQFWLNASDEDANKWIKIFTLLDPTAIESLIAEHANAPQLRILQKALAAELTKLVHSEADLKFALQATEILFGNATTEVLQSLNEEQLLQAPL